MRYAKKRALEQARVPPERLRCLARRVYELGERPLFELLSELQQGAPFAERVEAYAQLAELAPFIRSQGGDRLPIARVVAPTRKGKRTP
jgi:hypothetical protein